MCSSWNAHYLFYELQLLNQRTFEEFTDVIVGIDIQNTEYWHWSSWHDWHLSAIKILENNISIVVLLHKLYRKQYSIKFIWQVQSVNLLSVVALLILIVPFKGLCWLKQNLLRSFHKTLSRNVKSKVKIYSEKQWCAIVVYFILVTSWVGYSG